MELQQQMLQNGQELQTGDVNNLGEGALMDDRTLAEALRMLPNTGTVGRCILPFGEDDDSAHGTVATQQSADAKVYIYPFRAVIGSRTASSSDGLKAWRSIRSGVFVGGAGVWSSVPATALTVAQIITANSSGNARWDLIYAAVTPDASQPAVARAVKASGSGAVTTPGTVVQLACTVTIGYTQGTPSASPALPSIPADAAGVFYIPLAYVLVPNGFSGTSVVKPWMIYCASPTPIALSKGLGGFSAMPANQQNAVGGTVVSASPAATWASTSTVSISGRPGAYMPPEMMGVETIWVAIDVLQSNVNLWSHTTGSLVDGSRDWRNRVFKTTIYAGNHASLSTKFAWDRSLGSTTEIIPACQHTMGTPEAMGSTAGLVVQLGQSFVQDATYGGANTATICYADTTVLAQMTGRAVGLYVDNAGALRVFINSSGGSTGTKMFFWIEASRPYPNF